MKYYLENESKIIKIDSKQSIAFDEINKMISFVKNNELLKFSFSALKDIEVVKDGNTVVKGKGLKTLAGGLTFGIFGAVVGALGEKKTVENIEDLHINLKFNSLITPLYAINLINKTTKSDNKKYKEVALKLEELVSTFDYILNLDNSNDEVYLKLTNQKEINKEKFKKTLEENKEKNKELVKNPVMDKILGLIVILIAILLVIVIINFIF